MTGTSRLVWIRSFIEPAIADSDVPILSDRFDRAVVHRVLAEGLLLGRLRLFEDVGKALLVVAREAFGRGFAAEVAVDALRIDVVTTLLLSGNFVVGIGHFPRGRADSMQISVSRNKPGGCMKRFL